jgi:hypothetical protein
VEWVTELARGRTQQKFLKTKNLNPTFQQLLSSFQLCFDSS